nr:iron chelate uptake ABC transporter family permease subunit [Paenibacillus sp. 1-18]
MNKLQRARRRTIAWITLPVLLLAVSVYGLAYGSVSIPLQEINQVLLHNHDSIYRTILMDLRLPRVLVGLLVGACLAASGALLQGVMKNPLADPGVIGVSDTVARSWFDPIELPVGILLAVIGAPFFLILLKKRGNFG